MIEKVLKQIEHLPTLPQVVTKILAMTDSAKVNAVDISKEMDQSLSAKVLQSGKFGLLWRESHRDK